MDDPVLKAVQKFMDAVEERLSASDSELRGLATEVRGLLTELQTRATEIPKEGPPGKDGADGKDGRDGIDGLPGDKGDRGADGIATREELDSLIEQRFAELQVRSLADTFQGVYDQSKLYTKGQIAMWDGQPWLAMVPETRAMPGQSSDWKLFAKRGRDGRDAKREDRVPKPYAK